MMDSCRDTRLIVRAPGLAPDAGAECSPGGCCIREGT